METRTKQPRWEKESLKRELDGIYRPNRLDLALMKMHLERKDSIEEKRDYGLYYQ